MMLLICQAHDIIKSILFSLTFEHSPLVLVAWGLGLWTAVPCTAFMSQHRVTKSCRPVLQRSAGAGQLLAQTFQELCKVSWVGICQ